MVGDNISDVEAGLRAGCGVVVFVLTGGYSEEGFWKALSLRLSSEEVEKAQMGSVDELRRTGRVVVLENVDGISAALEASMEGGAVEGPAER